MRASETHIDSINIVNYQVSGMHEEEKKQLRELQNNYKGKIYLEIVKKVKKERINDDELLHLIEKISLQRFRDKVSLTLSVLPGNILEFVGTIAAIIIAYSVNSDYALYLSTLILMTTLHPLSHYLTGKFFGIMFTHYYLNGPARIEPTLRIDQSSYLKASGIKRAVMHASGVLGTLAAPIFICLIALDKETIGAAWNIFYFFLLLILFELFTSTRNGDLKKAKREYEYRSF